MRRVNPRVAREEILLKVVDYIYSCFDDEESIYPWLLCGTPDGADEEEIRDIADDYEDFADMMSLFGRLCKREALA